MNRNGFLRNIMGLSLFSLWGCQTDSQQAKLVALDIDTNSTGKKHSATAIRKELKAAWDRSETMTLTNVEQMPADLFTFKYTPEAMSFAEQWRHCVIYTCGQLSARTELDNPYKDIKLPVQMSKDSVIDELKNMYNYVRESIEKLSDEKLLSLCDFANDNIPVWRLFYALENHIIHHRGQCIVYLRLKGVVPKGYYGW